MAEWGSGGVDVDGGSGYIGEERVEDHVIFAVVEEDFAVGVAEFGTESFCELYGGKSSADDDYSDWFHGLLLLLGIGKKAAAQLPHFKVSPEDGW